MGDPYTNVTVTNYNLNPPSDDGSQAPSNQLRWQTHKEKIGDPLKDAIEDLNDEANAAFGRVVGGAGVTAIGTAYTVLATDQGKLLRATSAITITTPDATSVGSPFVFSVLNDSTGSVTIDGSGSQTVDGEATIAIPSDRGAWFYTDGSNWFTAGQNFALTRVVPQGRLTPTGGENPVIPGDRTNSRIFYTQFVGNLVPVSNGTTVTPQEFSQIAMDLTASHGGDNIYDVFVWNDDGTLRLITGPAWNNSSAGSGARGTGAGTTELTFLQGVRVNANSMTGRQGGSTFSVGASEAVYVGSLLIDSGGGQVTCHRSFGQNRKWGVWNAYNREPIMFQVGDSTASWTYSTDSWRASNNDSNNSGTVFAGLAEETVELFFIQNVDDAGTNTGALRLGIGVDSTSSPSGFAGHATTDIGVGGGTPNALTAMARHQLTPLLGISVVTCLERATTGAPHFSGGTDGMQLLVRWRG